MGQGVIQGYVTSLPRSAWRILTYDAVPAIRAGMVMPFASLRLERHVPAGANLMKAG